MGQVEPTEGLTDSLRRARGAAGRFPNEGHLARCASRADAFGQFRPASTFGEDARWNRRVELVLKSDDSSTVGAIEGLGRPNP